MSWNPALEPHCPASGAKAGGLDAIETLIIPRARDLGGFSVRRALPAPKRQMVGPFIFFDQMGPVEFLTEGGIDVRPHPHIGLATVTYLLEGSFRHRDSTGADQTIVPGDVNWMIAGSGVTHSERTGSETRATRHRLSGIQTWVALPEADEGRDASFEHRGAAELPVLEGEGKTVRLILGTAYGERAPVKTFSQMFYADAQLQPGARLPLPDGHEDRGVYIGEGAAEIAGETFEAGRMMVFRPGDAITVTAGAAGARLMLLGGDTLEGPRHIWWNFVASSKEKIEAAKEAWRTADFEKGRFHLPPGDDAEFIPLP
ncbi:MAG: pirin family protein [Rhizobiaceae bacterium]|nr:pirin family protein [Rhizobiaceae bacterium]